jgi:DNA-binding response OmpR family regulator
VALAQTMLDRIEGMTIPKRILLLGNAFRATKLVRQTLEKAGHYLLKEEQNSRAAFQTVRLFKPDVIFLGLGADAFDWRKTLEEIRSDEVSRTTPVFTLANTDASDSVTYGGSLNGYDFSVQPMKIEELVRSLDEMLRT